MEKKNKGMKHTIFLLTLLTAVIFTACKPDAVVPTNSIDSKEAINIFPDYTDVVIPPNIAPLNFMAKNQGDEFVARYATSDGKHEVVAAAGLDGKLMFDSIAWRELLTSARGTNITLTLYSNTNGTWLKHPESTITVAEEEIDPYLTYRLIEPSYELYRQLGLYQRNLTNFDEVPIYENNSDYEDENNHCINCHASQNYGETHRTLFHVRGEHGATIMAHDGKVERLNMKCDSTLGNAVYPAWHPTKPWIVFSSNRTGQAFYLQQKDKIEVIDYGSDLIFYDVENNKISNVLKTPIEMETFPTWAPDGKTLYYCSAYVDALSQIPDTTFANPKNMTPSDSIVKNFDKVHYNIMALDFDESTRTFGQPRLVLDCAAREGSATVPRVSPDGRWLLFTLGKFGQFHIWHGVSDLYVIDLQAADPAASVRRLDQANSDKVESFHNWSSNGRWIVVSSRRDDGSYSRPYIAYFDKEGNDHKAFLLPQYDPEQNFMRMKSYNVPELSRTAVNVTPEQFREAVYSEEIKSVQYGK